MPVYASKMPSRSWFRYSSRSGLEPSVAESEAACTSMFIVTERYLWKSPPMASAMSPKHESIGGFTLRLSAGFCRLRSSRCTISSQYGSTLPSRARQMSPTTPTATWHTWCSSQLESPSERKGRKCIMYFSKPASVALATAPTAMRASSCTVEFFAPKTCRKSIIIWSHRGIASGPSFCVTTCSVPQSSPCSSFCRSRSCASSGWILHDSSSLCMISGAICLMCSRVSCAALVRVVFSASYAEQRRLFSAPSGRCVHSSSAFARSTKSAERMLLGSLRRSSQCSARLCSAQQTLLATRGWSLSPARSTPSCSGGMPGCSGRIISCQCCCVIDVM
mmetsp:Transcript_20361/g.34694  ORF Transcript_20361/g.34694 Transcript_20361/m.34694 type:complete len:334 (+) Transcript_20361:676-1677(+)